jgi:hypothetical protein
MKYIKHRQTKFVASVVSVIVMAIVASWQFSLFVMFSNPQGHLEPQGGRYHLWLAVSAAVMASIAGISMFFLFCYDAKENDIRVETRRAPTGDNLIVKSPTSSFSDAIYRQLQEGHFEGQADDRRPMLGSVGKSTGSASARRSIARLAHQVMYKKWSQERHD